MIDAKQCARCQEVKPLSAFYTHKRWDGFHPYCKVCFNAYGKARREKKLATNPGRWRWKRDLVRHDYFHQIDSPMKAYILGFFAADGNLLARFHRITIELAAKDTALLSLIRDELVPGGNIRTRFRNGFERVLLAFTSQQMFDDLVVLGVTPVKSFTIDWPNNLSECYDREFILGVLDGDGHITKDRRYSYVGFTGGSFALLAAIVRKIEHHTGVRMGGPWKKTQHCFSIRTYDVRAITLDKWLHATGMGLERKKLTFLGLKPDGAQP